MSELQHGRALIYGRVGRLAVRRARRNQTSNHYGAGVYRGIGCYSTYLG